MSTDFIKLVPSDPMLRLDDATLEATRVWFTEKGAGYGEVAVESHDQPHFYDAGANFGVIACPNCESAISTADWGDWMGEDVEADKRSYRLEARDLACCNSSVTLNDLSYEWPMAFGKCAVIGRDMNIGIMGDEMQRDAESVLGAPITIVYSHL